MLFNSLRFLIFFPIVTLIYFLIPQRIKYLWLLAASYYFYMCWNPEYALLMAFSTAVTYLSGILISHCKTNFKKKLVVAASFTVNFAILFYFKYFYFTMDNINAIRQLFGLGALVPKFDVILPVGISFYTFQALSYTADVYRGDIEAEKNPLRYALFVSFFPQLVAGPIERSKNLLHQVNEKHYFDYERARKGILMMLWGFFQKLVIADRVLMAMNTMLDAPESYRGAYVLLLILMYSVQIYADFTGGIDITVGIAEAMGIRLAENFDRPFSSKSTKEYWRRWHITMGSWFRDYIFLPLSVTRPMLKLNKVLSGKIGRLAASKTVAYTASLVTWLATGIWHGAGWNFIVWGLMNCFIMIISETLEPLYSRFHAKFPRLCASGAYGAFMSVRTFLLMGIVRSLDCYRNVGLTFSMWGSMLTFSGLGDMLGGGLLKLGLGAADYVILIFGILTVYAVSKTADIREKLYRRPALCAVLCGALFVSTIMLGAYGAGYDASQFIYNQF